MMMNESRQTDIHPLQSMLKGILTLVFLSVVGCAAEDGYLEVIVHGKDDTTPMPCRAWIEAEGVQYFRPETPSTPYELDRSFSCDGTFRIRVPSGKASIHVERGKEFIPVDQTVTILPGQTTHQTIVLKRWITMYKEGWFSSDMHVHFGHNDLNVLKQLSLADDVNLLPAFTYWYEFYDKYDRGKEWPKKWPRWNNNGIVFVDPTHVITRANIEIERIGGEAFGSTGAPFFFNLNEPLPVHNPSYSYPGDAMLQKSAKETSPDCVIDTDKPLWAENVVGVALRLYDVVQICHNHYHRNTDLERCCGMIGAIDDSEKRLAGKDEELFIRTNEIYYRWLNCGFRLGVSGGSAMGVMEVPLGYNRTYAYVEGPLTPVNFWEAVRNGRTFATSGPILTMTANGEKIGATLRLSSNHKTSLRINANVRSIQKLTSLEIIQNGKIIKKEDLTSLNPNPSFQKEIEMTIKPERSGWVAARALFKTPQGHWRLAHTSPIYFLIDNKPIVSRKDAEYMIKWIDELLKISNEPGRYPSDLKRDEVQQIFHEARTIYESVKQKAGDEENAD